ncbi:MAG: N-acetylmuramoyl-L-alanine amidase [Paenisporosarcina sp.]
MGNHWLHNMPDILRQGVGKGITGLELVDNWETRARGSGGLDRINGLLNHHTASPASWDWYKDIEYIAYTNPYSPSPIAQLYHGRDGRVAIIAAGAANHGGSGGPYKPGGPTYVGVNRANYDLIGNEMGNNGTGEPWPWPQIMAAITTNALICLAYNWSSSFVFAHKEYCGPGTTTPGRKVDPFGPWENHPWGYWPAGSSWGPQQGSIDLFRSLVTVKMGELSQESPSMNAFVPRADEIAPRIMETRGTPGPHYDQFKMNAEYVAKIPVPNGPGKSFAIVNITATEPETAGFFTAWGDGPRPKASCVNYAPGQTVANEVTVELAPDGTIQVYTSARTHLVIDLVGYYQPF